MGTQSELAFFLFKEHNHQWWLWNREEWMLQLVKWTPQKKPSGESHARHFSSRRGGSTHNAVQAAAANVASGRLHNEILIVAPAEIWRHGWATSISEQACNLGRAHTKHNHTDLHSMWKQEHWERERGRERGRKVRAREDETSVWWQAKKKTEGK